MRSNNLTFESDQRRLGVVGSRTFSDYEQLKDVLDSLPFNVEQIISGGARGADRLGKRYAQEHNIECKEFIPDWDTHGKAAGMIRNRDIVESSDYLAVFWDGKSRGTKHSLNLAMKKKIPILIIPFDEEHDQNA